MAEIKGKYHVKEGHRIKHNGGIFESGAELELTEAEAATLHVETADERKARQVLDGKASYEPDTPKPNTNALLEKISEANSVETVEALMSLSGTKTVKAAGDKRLKELAPVLSSKAAELMEKINGAETVELLQELGSEVIDWKDATEHKALSDAYSAREEELKE